MPLLWRATRAIRMHLPACAGAASRGGWHRSGPRQVAGRSQPGRGRRPPEILSKSRQHRIVAWPRSWPSWWCAPTLLSGGTARVEEAVRGRAHELVDRWLGIGAQQMCDVLGALRAWTVRSRMLGWMGSVSIWAG